MHLLWRENADILTDADINPLSSLPTLDAISKILSDPRYTSRFNLIWKNSSLISEDLPNWKNEEWFGDFWDVHFPWVFHEDLGWIYVAGVSPTSFWLYSENLGWVWSGATHYPSLYSNNEQGWIYFDKSKSLYYSYVTKAWKTF